MKYNILIISPNFNQACGVSKNVFTILSSEELKKEFNFYFVTNGGDALYRLDEAGIHFSLLNFKINKLLHFDIFRNGNQLVKFCVEKKIDLIHSHHRYPDYLSNYVKSTLKIKSLVTVHNFVFGMKRFSYRSDIIIAINNSIKEHLKKEYKIDSNNIVVLYNCVKKESGKVDNRNKTLALLNIPENANIILYLGRIVKEKGIDILIRAFNIISRRQNNIYLIIVGTGGEVNEKFKNENADRIKILPAVKNTQPFYSIANAVILPSFNEPFGYTMLEAGLNNIPFIGSRTGGIAEFIEDGINGYLFEPGNYYELAEKIKFIIENPEIASASASNLNKKVIQLCNCETYFKKLTDIYHHLLVNS